MPYQPPSAQQSQAATPRPPRDTINIVVRVTLWGGLIGFFAGSAHAELRRVVRNYNQQGWRVVQVLDDPSGNVFVLIVRILLLIVTFFLFTTNNGFMVVFERASSDANLTSGGGMDQDYSPTPPNLDVKGNLGF